MTISASLVKDLRDKTGAGMMDCKSALTETKGDLEAAVDWLRKKGLSKAAKKAGRVAAEGLIGIDTKGKSGATGAAGRRFVCSGMASGSIAAAADISASGAVDSRIVGSWISSFAPRSIPASPCARPMPSMAARAIRSQ